MHRILITNDDGFDADGLLRLASAARAFGEVWIVAPETQRSASSHSITLHGTFTVAPRPFPLPEVRAFVCSGTPADCVRIGCLNIVPGGADVVLSGINYGYNSGTDIQYSATVGAALEGAFQNCHSIALSEGASPCHAVTDAYLKQVLAELLERPLGYGEVFNVNFPDCPLAECKGILRDRPVSHGTFYRDRYVQKASLPEGGARYMVEGEYNEDAEEGTDFRAIVDGYLSIGVVRNLHG